MQQYHTIQYLRGFACLLVVLHHAQSFIPQWTDSSSVFLYSFEYIRYWGKVGVDVFFVISGFIITKVLFKTNYSLNSTRLFLKKRFIRVVPLYWFYTLVTILFAVEFSPEFSIPFSLNQLFYSFSFLPEVSNGKYQLPLLPVGWTLSLEIAFYISAVLVALLCKRFWVIALTIALLAFHEFHQLSWMSAKSTISSHYFIEFLIGVWIATLESKGIRLPKLIVKLCAFSGFIALFACIYLKFSWTLIIMQITASGLIVASAVFASHSSQAKSSQKVPPHKILGLLGDASYTIYLSHAIILGGLNARLVPIVLNRVDIDANLLAIALSIIATISGIIAYIIFEKPMLGFLKRKTLN